MKKLIAAGVIAVLLVPFILGTFFVVQPSQVGVKVRMGSIVGAYTEGLHFKFPIIDSVLKKSTIIEKDALETEAFSKDLQTVKSSLTVNYRVSQDNVIDVYRNLGADYVSTILNPATQECFKAITAKYSAEQIVTSRETLVTELYDMLKAKMLVNKIMVTGINITNLDFSNDFTASVERKQIAEQDAKTAENLVRKVRMEADAAIAKAKGEAEALRLQREVVTPQLIELKRLDVQNAAIAKWNGSLPEVIMGGNATPFVDISQFTKK